MPPSQCWQAAKEGAFKSASSPATPVLPWVRQPQSQPDCAGSPSGPSSAAAAPWNQVCLLLTSTWLQGFRWLLYNCCAVSPNGNLPAAKKVSPVLHLLSRRLEAYTTDRQRGGEGTAAHTQPGIPGTAFQHRGQRRAPGRGQRDGAAAGSLRPRGQARCRRAGPPPPSSRLPSGGAPHPRGRRSRRGGGAAPA